MSYSTPIESTTSFKDLEVKLQKYSAELKRKLSWLTYAFGLADRTVELRNNKPYIFPAIYQDSNREESISLMPSDLYPASCFWTDGEGIKMEEDNWSRLRYNVSCIFYCDLKNIAPTENWKLTRTKIRQDIIEAFRQIQYSGLGVIILVSMVEDDIAQIYEGFTMEQVDNKFKMYPKYAIRLNFEVGFLRECGSFNTYA